MMDEHDRKENISRIIPVKSNIKAIMGETNITIRELLELERGDVLRLDRHANQDIDILVGNRKKFRGKPGHFGKNVAVKINSLV